MPRDAVQKLLQASLDAGDAAQILGRLAALLPAVRAEAEDFGLLLSDVSAKAAVEYFRVVPETLAVLVPSALGLWVGMGMSLAEKSAAVAIRFFRQGPTLFSRLPDHNLQERLLREGIALARQNPHLALEYYQQAPLLLAATPMSPDALHEWAAQGMLLGQADYTLAVEYFRIAAGLLPVVPISHLARWVAVARGIEPLFSQIVFIRTSPETFAASGAPLRLLDLMTAMSGASAGVGKTFHIFSAAATTLAPFQPHQLHHLWLKRTTEIARLDPEIAAMFFLNGPKLLDAVGAPYLAAWVDEGTALLMRDPIAARAYFAWESKGAQTARDRLRGGVALSTAAGSLTIFAAALAGRPVEIAPLSESDGVAPMTDGQTIFLPAHIAWFPNEADNVEWYKVATAFQAGFLEYGTFTPTLAETADLIESLQAKYQTRGGLRGLTAFFSLFPEPATFREIFQIAEGARVAFRLQQDYPGLRRALVRMRATDLATLPPLMGRTPQGVMIALLQQVALAGVTRDAPPPEMQSAFFEACRILGGVQSAEATVARSMRAAAQVYDLIVVDGGGAAAGGEAFEEQGERRRGDGAGGGEIRPATTRGVLMPERVERAKAPPPAGLLAQIVKAGINVAGVGSESAAMAGSISDSASATPETDAGERGRGTGASDGASNPSDLAEAGYDYDEWDCGAEDYRPAWCHLVERPVVEKAGGGVLLSDVPVAAVVRAFSRLRPEGRTRVRGAQDGDQLDLDRLIESRVDRRMRRTPSDRIYIDHFNAERSVAAAFLVDMSGSTARVLPESGKSLFRVEQETLALLTRALAAIGDRFALFGFSSRGRHAVDFHVIKSFDDRADAQIDDRIFALSNCAQNRDGAAIRHAVRHLATEGMKTKLLILISDGRPLDDGYDDAYATADTRMALREARQAGVFPLCITVDPAGDAYVRALYGEVAYLVIDSVESLPRQLPRLYRRLTT